MDIQPCSIHSTHHEDTQPAAYTQPMRTYSHAAYTQLTMWTYSHAAYTQPMRTYSHAAYTQLTMWTHSQTFSNTIFRGQEDSFKRLREICTGMASPNSNTSLNQPRCRLSASLTISIMLKGYQFPVNTKRSQTLDMS